MSNGLVLDRFDFEDQPFRAAGFFRFAIYNEGKRCRLCTIDSTSPEAALRCARRIFGKTVSQNARVVVDPDRVSS